MKIKIKKLNEMAKAFQKTVRVIENERLEKSFAFLDKEEIILFISCKGDTIEINELTKEIYKKLGGLKNGNIQAKK